MTSLLVLGGFVGVMVALAGTLTLVSRRWLGGPPPPPRRPRRPRRYRKRVEVVDRTADGAKARWVRRGSAPVTRRRPVEEVAADLRRLARELAAVPAGAPYVRWQALQNAYDRVLVEAAELLEVTHDLADLPVMGTARDVERLRVVCTLEANGLVVQD